MQSPVLSVLMPVYNASRFLREAVDSVLSQTFRDFELIAVDDGSTDDSAEILSDYAKKDPRVRLVRRPNGGVSAATNQGLALCRGEFVARMDSDDVSLPNRFEIQVRFLREHPDCVAVGAQVLFMDADGLPLYRMPGLPLTHEEIDNGLLLVQWTIVQGTAMFRTAAIQGVGGYRVDLRIHEDHDLFLKLAEVGRLANVPDVLLKYRQHPTSSVTACADAHVSSFETVFQDAWKRRGLVGLREMPPIHPYSKDPDAMLKRHRLWGWMSLKAGNVASARKYARAGLRLAPLSLDSWRLMYSSLRGY